MNIKDYIYAFSHLRKGVTKFGPAPHKLILLLAVIQKIEAGRIVKNRIAVTDALLESFMTVWNENVHSGYTATFALPFFHLQSEGIWQLHAYPQHQEWLNAQDSVASATTAFTIISTFIPDCKRSFIRLLRGNNETGKAAMFQEAAIR